MNHQVNRPRIADENIDGEVIIIDFDSGCYFSTSDMGSLVWDLIDKGVDSDDIVRKVTEHYGDIAQEAAEKAIRHFINDLEREGLIVSSENVRNPDPAVNAVPEFPSAFSAPKLEKFTDMQDLLLLDPIHEVDETGWPRKK